MRDLPPTQTLTGTRDALHRVAEHVLSAARKSATGQIGLEQGPDGFRTPPLPDGRVVAVVVDEIVVSGGDGVRRERLTTLRAAARLAGIEPGFPWTKHPPATVLEPDVTLDIDPEASRVLAGWFALGQEALVRLSAALANDGPSHPTIYPEHFDLAISAAEVNYGFSPGDAELPLPYAYVGPYAGPPVADDFWNAPFGAYRTSDDLPTVDDALAFFIEARKRLLGESAAG